MNPAGQSSGQPQQRVPGTLGSFEILGVPVRFHFTFWLFVVWLIVLGAGGQQSVAGTAAYVLALFASVLLHEFAHSFAARRFGVRTSEIAMLPLGGLARFDRQLKPSEEFWVSLAGPLVNFLLGAGLLGWTVARGGTIDLAHWKNATDENLAFRIATANLLLAFFNLLPAFPMDGGRIVRSLLAARRPLDQATKITARIGMVLAAGMALYGLLNANFILVFFAFFIYAGAAQESVASTTQVLMQGAKVTEAMVTDFRILRHGETIRDAASLLLATSQQDFPVVAGETVVGLLGRAGLLRAMASEGPDAYVAGVMDRDFIRLAPDEDLEHAAARLSSPSNCALVFDGDRLLGLLTAENLSEFLILRQIRRAQNAPGQTASEPNGKT